MNIKYFFVFIFLTFIYAADGQEKLTITPDKPERGQVITIRYNPSAPGATIPVNAEKVEMVFTYSNFYEVPSKLSMQKNGNVWEAKIPLARYATYATFYLQSGEIKDQPAADQHYAIAVYDNGRRVKSGYLYEGYSISAQTGKVPDLTTRQAKLFAEELEHYPDNYEAKLRLLNYRISKATGAEKEKLTREAEAIIAAKFYENPGKMGFMNSTTMGYLIIGQNSRLDSIRQVVKMKYPDTEAGYELRISDITKEKDKAKMEQQLLALLKTENKANKEYLKSAHEALMRYYVSKKQTNKALYHLNKSGDDNSPYRARTLKQRAQLFYEAGIALDTALSLANRSLSIVDSFPIGLIRFFPETGHIPSFVDNETRIKEINKAKGNLLSLISLIQLKQGKRTDENIKEALKVSSDNETLSNAGEYFRKTGDSQLAFENYKKIMFQTPEDTISARKMKETYLEWNKTSEGLDTHIAELNTHWQLEMLKQLRKEVINISAPDFVSALVDLKGQPVSKDALKNKIVVLDFWATWCVPCMHEMPYLQKAYDNFKNDPDVVFMVINSGSKNSLADAQGWWGNEKYSFPVYYNNDPMIGDKLKFNVIPALYIIDQAGNIRFKTIGFEGPVIERKVIAAINLLREGNL